MKPLLTLKAHGASRFRVCEVSSMLLIATITLLM